MTSPSTTLSLVDTDPAELAVDAIVIGVHSQTGEQDATSGPVGSLLLGSGAESIAAAFDGKLTETLALLGATGAPGEVIKLATLGTITAPIVAAVGLGAEPTGAAPAPETLRRAAGSAVRALVGAGRVALSLPLPDDADAPAALRAVAEGALLGGYRFAGYKTKPQPARREPVAEVLVAVPDAGDATAQAEIARAATVAGAVRLSRDWVNTAPNDKRPPAFADTVAEAARAAGLTVEVLDEAALAEGGYGGIIAVGQGSEAPPRLVKITYTPEGGATGKRVALVGKGITFDTGGISIKPSQGMWEMKSDMAGAAAVAATMLAVAALKPSVAVSAYVPMAENMPSGTAYRPGDVITMFNGKRVEVLNTDAEGRMVLADAMARACADGCDYLVETSTLTGGQVISLGKRVAGVMGTPELCERVKAVGDAVGEPAWPMPLPDDVRKGMDSDVADISQVNAGMDRAGHMLQGGTFLREFVSDDVAWAHIDIAGPSYHSGEPTGYWTKGGTGVPVRTLVQLVEDIAAEG
ncbi:leucyl aminopeptidase [Micromonospora sagamiensis]|uniref:Probable cytosol aminopeptidase n=1 Tax=Micromonospora sagamiensis TaxID=47875 RepID=A0A562WDR9_9ACTN|nr:leucyl aminopeptidase [Micromonospora sagamiensis]TWJ28027.1 leucyl aminopeptidase [Micromonospora sagamiensis]BCL13082.1 putative cytosol aminopeptidase [Micromonospora sagamiensis]